MTTENGAATRPTFKITKHVTRPLLKMEPGVEYFVTFEGAIYKADPLAAGRVRSDAAPKEPPYLANVLDLVHNKRPSQIIVNAVLKSELEKVYPDQKYVGRTFRLVKSQIQGKNYATFEIQEGSLDDGSDEGQQSTEKATTGTKKR